LLKRHLAQSNLPNSMTRAASPEATRQLSQDWPLGWAAQFGELPMVELFLKRGAKPNLADDRAWATPFK
jgi:hypothetical protein